jgi:hypothetical protein
VKNNPPKTRRIRRNGPHIKFAKAEMIDSIWDMYFSIYYDNSMGFPIN